MSCINRMPWLFPGYLDFTTTAPVIPKLYWQVESQEQRWLRICEQLGKVICYSDCLGKQLNITMQDVKDLQSEFEEFKASGFFDYYAAQLEKWINDNMERIISTAIKMVFFGLTDDGYFCAYIPESWNDITFDTGAVFGRTDYGRLILRFNNNGNGVIDNTYSYSLDYEPEDFERLVADVESVTRRNDAAFATLFTNLDEEVIANGNF